MSCTISTSPATSGSILMLSRFFWPSIATVTLPPPAVAVTLIRAISCCIFSCICCAWRIICCMLPGSFTVLLLEIADFAYFAAKNVAETLYFGVGQRAPRGVVLFGRLGRGQRNGRRCGGVAGGEFQAQRLAEHLADRFLEA